MAVIVSPYLYFALAHPNPIHEGLQPETYVADLENLLFPTPVTWLFSDGLRRRLGPLRGQPHGAARLHAAAAAGVAAARPS